MKHPATLSGIIRSTVVPLIIGLAAGVTGALTAESYLSATAPAAPLPPFARPLSAVTAPLPETGIAERLDGLNVALYPKKAGRAGEPVERIVLPNEAVGRAAVITSDGWLMTHQSVAAGGVLVGIRGKLVEPSRTVVDDRTGAVFLKVDAGSLTVGGFEATESLRPGTPLYARDGSGQFIRSYFSGASPPERKNRADALQSSDRFTRVFRFGRLSGARAYGGAVVTAGGNLVGILAPDPKSDGSQAAFVPMHLLRPVLPDVFRNQPLRRAALGVRYFDLESVASAGDPLEYPRGARLAGSRKDGIPGVAAGSAAAAAGLAEGDVILRVGDAELSGGRDLAELIGEYRSGDKIKLEVLRRGERKPFDVALH